jgi:HD superfamily phosphodiesterase
MSKVINIEEIEKAFPELNMINNVEWRKKVCNIWKEVYENSRWERLNDAQYNPLAPGISLVDHTKAVTLGALDLAKNLNKIFNVPVNNDVLIVSCLLHDVCKLMEYEPADNGTIAKKSMIGKLYQHGFLSGYYALKEDFPESIVSILVCHTAESKTIPRSIEGIALYYADMADADFHRLIAGAPLLLENKK